MHDGTTPLILAARLAVEGMVEELINCHADVNAADDFGMEPFFKGVFINIPTTAGWRFSNELFLVLQVNLLCTGLRP